MDLKDFKFIVEYFHIADILGKLVPVEIYVDSKLTFSCAAAETCIVILALAVYKRFRHSSENDVDVRHRQYFRRFPSNLCQARSCCCSENPSFNMHTPSYIGRNLCGFIHSWKLFGPVHRSLGGWESQLYCFYMIKEHWLGPFVYSFKHFEVYLGHQIVGECRCMPSIHVHHRLPQVIVFQSALFTVANANLRQFITYFEQRWDVCTGTSASKIHPENIKMW